MNNEGNVSSLQDLKKVYEYVLDPSVLKVTDPAKIKLMKIYANDEAKFLLFAKWCKNILSAHKDSADIYDYLEQSNQDISYTLMSAYIPFNIVNFPRVKSKCEEGKLMEFKKFTSNNKRIVSYTCPGCGNDVAIDNDFLVFMYDSEHFKFSYEPMICPDCGVMSIFKKEVVDKITENFRDTFLEQRVNMDPLQSLRSYIPRIDVIEKWLSDFYIVDFQASIEGDDNVKFSGVEEINIDWDLACKDFLAYLNMVGDSKFKIGKLEKGSVTSVRNVSKLVANQYDSYARVKENAVASLLQVLSDSGLFKFSLSVKSLDETLSTIETFNGVSESILTKLAEATSINVFVDGKVSYDKAEEALVKVKGNVKNFDSNLEEYLQELEDNKYLLSFLPITNMSLRTEVIYNYLYDDRIVSVLDSISDLMILNHYAEDVFKFMSLSSIDNNGNIKDNTTLSRAKKNLLDLNKTNKRKDYMDKILNAVYVNKSEKVSPAKFLLSYLTSADSINEVSSFLDACYRRDVYDMMKYYPKVTNLLPLVSDNSFICRLSDFCLEFKYTEIKGSKFDYYFGFECDNEIQEAFVKVYEDKGFVPKELHGETILDKLNYYTNLNINVEVKDFVPKSLDSLLDTYKSLFTYGRFIDYHNLFSDYVTYMFSREMLYNLCYSSIDNVLNLLSIDKEIATLLLEDSYTFPSVDKEIVDNFYLVTFPYLEEISSESSTSNVIANEASYKNLIASAKTNADNIKVNYKELPGLLKLLELEDGDD